jgi:hypothetical protein
VSPTCRLEKGKVLFLTKILKRTSPPHHPQGNLSQTQIHQARQWRSGTLSNENQPRTASSGIIPAPARINRFPFFLFPVLQSPALSLVLPMIEARAEHQRKRIADKQRGAEYKREMPPVHMLPRHICSRLAGLVFTALHVAPS